MIQSINYFAYGSNMHLNRLRQRVRSCSVRGAAELQGHVLRFHKRSPDGSGKCNIVRTDQAEDRVFGVLYRIDRDDKALLDEAEAVGDGYNVGRVIVSVGGSPHRAYTYLADAGYIDDALKPYSWYKELVVTGARLHELPLHYVTSISRYEAIDDPNVSRANRHRQILRQPLF